MASSSSRTVKRKCTFNEDLQAEFPFLEKRPNLQDSDVYCKLCNKTFSIAGGGRWQIEQHNRGAFHQKCVQDKASSKTVTNYFSPQVASKPELELAAKEGALAFHTVLHDHSFNSVTCTSKLIRATFDQKFTCGKTKCEAIAVKVLYPEEVSKLMDILKNVEYLSIAVDCSNHKNIKLMPVVVRYFTNTEGVQVKVLQIHSLTGETSDLMLEKILETLKKYNIQDKVISFCGDNANVNFGGRNRSGTNNLFTKLKSKTKDELIGIGCAAHIIHNGVGAAADMLPYDFESLLRKIYNHFSVFTVRNEKLKEFCEFVMIEFHVLLSTCKTRWLSLGPALERVLQLYDALKSYFVSENNCVLLKKLFQDPAAEIYMWFLHGQLHVFNQAILKLEKESVSAIETAATLQNLIESLQLRKNENFIGMKTKQVLKTLVDSGEIIEREFYKVVESFYESAINYIQSWGYPLEELKNLKWINLFAVPQWSAIEESIPFLQQKGVMINDNLLFDEYSCLQKYATKEMIETWTKSNATVADRWKGITSHFRKEMISFGNFERIVSFALSLPGSNAAVERIFSLMNNYWTDNKSNLSVETLEAAISLKVNVKEDCVTFYENLKKNVNLLKKIHSSNKYI